MAMKREARSILVRCSAGVVAIALVVFGVSQCSGKKAARTELDSVRTEIEKSKTRADNAEEALLDARDSVSYYQYQFEDLKDQIAVRDTALTEMAKNLENCGKGKKRTTSTKRTPRTTRPASKQAATTVVTVNTAPAKTNTQNTAPATVVTVTAPEATPINANGVTIDENAHHNNVNINNGTVNNYYAPVDTVKKYAAASQTIVVKRRVVCVQKK